MQINKATLDFLFQQWDQRFQAAYASQAVFWDRYATLMPSNTSQSVHSWLEQQDGLHEWIGGRRIDNVVARDYTLRNKDYEKTIGLDRNKIKDDSFGVFSPAVDQLGQQSALWPDDVMTSTLQLGTSAECWDGQYYFDTDHPVDLDDSSKGVYSNLHVGATYDLSADPIGAFDAASTKMMEVLGADGRPILGSGPDTIMVPPRLRRFALTVANAGLTAQAIKNAAGSENVGGAGVTNVYEGSITVIVNPRLSYTNSPWYLMKTNGAIKPLLWQLREAPVLTARMDPTDPTVFDNRTFLYGVEARGAGGYTFPWLCHRMSAA